MEVVTRLKKHGLYQPQTGIINPPSGFRHVAELLATALGAVAIDIENTVDAKIVPTEFKRPVMRWILEITNHQIIFSVAVQGEGDEITCILQEDIEENFK